MKKNFNLFVASSALSLLGIEVFHITLPLLALSLNLDPIQISWCVFAFYCPVIFVKIASSTFIERKNKIRILKMSESGRILCTLLFILSLAFFSDDGLMWILVISFLYGVFTVFTEVAEPVVIKNLIQGQASTAALSTYEIRTRAVQLLAPALCGYLIAVDVFLPYYFNLLLAIFALGFLYFIKMQHTPQVKKQRSGITEDLGIAVGWLKQHRLFSLMILLTAINNFLHPILYLTVIWDLKEQNTAFEITGLVLSGLGAGGLIGSFIARKLINTLPLRNLTLIINILRVLVFAGFLVSMHPVWVFMLFVFKAILGGVWNVSYNVFTIQEMPAELAARISAISGTLVKLSAGVGSLIAGYMLSMAGSLTTLITLVILTLFMLSCSFVCKAEYSQYNESR
ncbi:MFS transporter [Klebsiella sp. BIGb0407]|uniref:MFS transporter n=1 Tax=Klebsiella sp. BIGb0407 TaxID=2940603 RepID=UPI0021688492|nr:MFS transporter [Klebsiella sp. BIGb0407]MCS3429892.1 putative MFS family arabinose efflux permease [Klebsiella sp. BIGb0407]